MKVIINKSNEARVPKLLVDFVLQDAATQLSRLQYLALIELAESFERINIKRLLYEIFMVENFHLLFKSFYNLIAKLNFQKISAVPSW